MSQHLINLLRCAGGDLHKQAADQIEWLQAAKVRALKIADERSKEATELRAQLASARKALKAIAEHPESKTFTYIDHSSYGVGWAFWNVQQIAKSTLTDETGK